MIASSISQIDTSRYAECPMSRSTHHSSHDCPINSNLCKYIRSWRSLRYVEDLDFIRKTTFILSFAKLWGIDLTLDRTRDIFRYLGFEENLLFKGADSIRTADDLISILISEEICETVFEKIYDENLDLQSLFDNFFLHVTVSCPFYLVAFPTDRFVGIFIQRYLQIRVDGNQSEANNAISITSADVTIPTLSDKMWLEEFNRLIDSFVFSTRMEYLVTTMFVAKYRGRFELIIGGKNITGLFLSKFLRPQLAKIMELIEDFPDRLQWLFQTLADTESSIYRNHIEPFIMAGFQDYFRRQYKSGDIVRLDGVNLAAREQGLNIQAAITGASENINSGNRQSIKKKNRRPKAHTDSQTETDYALMTINSPPSSPPLKLSRRFRGQLDDVTKSIFAVFKEFAIDNNLIREENPLMEYPFLIRLSSNEGYKKSLREFFDSSDPSGQVKPINEFGLQGLDQASEPGRVKLISKKNFFNHPRGCFITTDQPYARPGDIPANTLEIIERLGFSGENRLQASYFITKKESNTPLHWDGARTLYVATRGLRVWKIFPPWFSPWITDKKEGSYARAGLHLIENNFEELGEYCLTVELKEGDILIIPAGWWHLVQGKILPDDEFSAAYNIGYADPYFESNLPFYSLCKKMKDFFDTKSEINAKDNCRQLLEKAVMEGMRIHRDKRLK